MTDINSAIEQLEQQIRSLQSNSGQQPVMSNKHIVTSKAGRSVMCGASSGEVKTEWQRHKDAVYKKYNVGGSIQENNNE